MSAKTLDERLTALREAIELGRGRIGTEELKRVEQVLARAEERRTLSSEHTVVGFFGATGSGKSSLFNAVTETNFATAHVRRPTTSEPLAAIWQAEGSEPLLDWLEVTDRRPVKTPFPGGETLPLILLDLPDFDSIAIEHRAIVERLVGQVDVLVWVVDPQKYADETIHNDFIKPLAKHAKVSACVLNQVDRLPEHEVPRVLASLEELLRSDGLGAIRILPASALTGDGVPAVQQLIARFARSKATKDARLLADLDTAAASLDAGSAPAALSGKRAQEMVSTIASAAGVDTVADAVARSYRHRAGLKTGWPLTAWMLRFSKDPLTRLHLPTSQRAAARKNGRVAEVHRTALPPLSAGQSASIARAVRSYADAAGEGLAPGWQQSIRDTANAQFEELPHELDRAIAGTSLGARGSWWWVLVAILQWVSLLAAFVGACWYLAVWFLPGWGLPAPEITLVEGWPVPGLLIVGGILLGILLGILSSALAAGLAAARRSRARRRLTASVKECVNAEIVKPIEAERARAEQYRKAVKQATRSR